MENTQNILGTERVSKLMLKFAIPSIIAMLVGAIYNIVDQLFIGNAVGPLGNAATNIAFPLSTSCVALALLFGIGGASCFNLDMGKGESKKAPHERYKKRAADAACGDGMRTDRQGVAYSFRHDELCDDRLHRVFVRISPGANLA